jgi:hypothetical protein
MTKADFITVIAEKLKFPLARAELLVDVVFGCMEQSMSCGEKIEMRATRPNYPYPYTRPMRGLSRKAGAVFIMASGTSGPARAVRHLELTRFGGRFRYAAFFTECISSNSIGLL